MKERIMDSDAAIPTDHQAAVIAEPGEGAFCLPAPLVSPQFTTVVKPLASSVLTIRADQIDSPTLQTLPAAVLRKALKLWPIIVFFGVVALGILIVGHLFNLIM
jgi:hypothetical protein